jgi:hypothetical protein
MFDFITTYGLDIVQAAALVVAGASVVLAGVNKVAKNDTITEVEGWLGTARYWLEKLALNVPKYLPPAPVPAALPPARVAREGGSVRDHRTK